MSTRPRVLPEPLAESARALQPGGSAVTWLELAQGLRAAGFEGAAFALIEEGHQTGQLNLEHARTMLLQLGALPFRKAGRGFAEYTGKRLAQRAPEATPTVLVPTEQGWRCFEAGRRSKAVEATGLLLELEPEHNPATWLSSDTLVMGRGADLHTLTRPLDLGSEAEKVFRLPGHIDELMRAGRSGRCVASVQSPGPMSNDLYVADIETRSHVFMPNLDVSLDVCATPWSEGLVCCRSGVQSSEVRFVKTTLPATWTTRFAHASSVRSVGPVDDGRHVCSIDRNGLVLIWQGEARSPVPRVVRSAQLPASLLLSASHVAMEGPEAPRIFVYDAAQKAPALICASLEGDPWRRLPGLGPQILPIDGLLLARSRRGWVWLDSERLTLREHARLSAVLATEEELRACGVASGLDGAHIEGVLETRDRTATRDAGPSAALGELEIFIRAPRVHADVLSALVHGRLPAAR